MSDLEERFASLDLLEPPEQWAAIERKAQLMAPPTTPRRWTPLRVAAVAVVVTLVFFGGLVLLRGPDLQPEEVVDDKVETTVPPTVTTPAAVTTAVAPSEATASTLAQPSVSGMVWQRAMDDSLRDGVIWDITVGGPGLVAVGQDGPGFEEWGVVWVSSDGHTWDRIDIDEGQRSYFDEVAAGPSGLVAFGRLGMDAGIWHSPDGYEWTNVFIADTDTWYEEMDVFVGGPGWVAVETDDTPRAFVSEDGITWIQVEDPAQTAEFVVALEQPDPIELLSHPGLDGSLSMLPPETAVNGDVIVRVTWADRSIWATIDSGETWQETTTDAPPFSWTSHLSTVTAFGNGFVVVGSAGDDDAGIWIGEWMEGKGELE